MDNNDETSQLIDSDDVTVEKKYDGKRFSFWNMLMGSTLLTMPWAFSQAGLAQALIVQIVMCSFSFYTAYILLRVGQKFADPVTREIPEMLELCGKLIGRWSGWITLIGSFVIMVGALIVYWILMSQLLYNSVNSIHYFAKGGNALLNLSNTTAVQCITNKSLLQSKQISSIPGWSEDFTVPLILIPIFLPILQMKRMTFFSKLGAFGTISVVFLLFMVLLKCFLWGPNVDFANQESKHYIPQFLGSFPALSGLLGMAYFIHNSIATVFNNNRRSENNFRDLTVGYFLVFLTYVFIGLGIYLTFPQNKSCIQQNFLENLPWNDWLSLATQLIIFFRMVTVFPIVAYIIRTQIFVAFFNEPCPGKFKMAVFSASLVTSCVLCAIFFPNIGDIIRYAGAFCGMIIMFFLPCLLHILIQAREGNSSKVSVTLHVLLGLVGVFNFVGQFTVKG